MDNMIFELNFLSRMTAFSTTIDSRTPRRLSVNILQNLTKMQSRKLHPLIGKKIQEVTNEGLSAPIYELFPERQKFS